MWLINLKIKKEQMFHYTSALGYRFALPLLQLIMLSAQTGYINSWLTSTSTLVRVRTWRIHDIATWRREYFNLQLYSAPSVWNPAPARRNRANTFTLLTTKFWYLATAYSVCIPNPTLPRALWFTRHAGCTFCLNDREHVIRHNV